MCLQFPKRFLSEEELKRIGVNDCDTHLEGMKRYSEFDKLHSSLLKSPMSSHVKGQRLHSSVVKHTMCESFDSTWLWQRKLHSVA